jgi:Flp pilus assembly protein TadD
MRTLKKSPNKARVANNLGYVYQQAARIDEARNADVRAMGLDPSYWKARINLGVLEGERRR